ncbi:MAG: hypothetical protein GXO87_05495 [Chlorobi bacterium]|nr:hypothetical protein [Chlorobiota bacterium]
MKNLLFTALIAFLLILISSCDILKPEDIQDDNPPDANTVSVGVDGGEINVDDFSIVIPPGAFQQTANLKVYQSNVAIPGEDVVTSVYSIEGLPDNYSLPIDVSIKLSNAVSGETYLALQGEAFVPSLNEVDPSYSYFKAAVSGDTIKGQIPAMSGNKTNSSSAKLSDNAKSPAGIFSLHIFGCSNKRTYTTDNNHFKITYDVSKDNPTDITNLGTYLETAYSKIKSIGFDLGKRTNWPVSVSIAVLGNAHGLFTPSRWSKNDGYLRFDRSGLSDQELMKTSAIHEFFHLVQYLYDSRGAFRQGSFAPDHYWFNEACSVWSEKLVASADYVSSNWLANQLRPFNGLQAGASDNPEKHGYGMASFIEYLTNDYGKSVLVDIYEKILAQRHVIDAINNSVNYNLYLDCGRFFKRYSQGLVFPDFGPGNLSQIVEDEFDITSAGDTLKTFTANYKDLSAKVYLVKLQNPDFQTDDSLEISIDQNLCNITVFKYPSPGNVSVIAEGEKSCVIPDIKGLRDQHKQLYVMVTNSNFISNNYQPSNLDIKLTMRVKSSKKISVDVIINIDGATYKEKVNNDNWVILNNEEFIFTPSAGVHGPKIGTLINNTFTSPLDDVYNPLNVESSYIKITFLENPKRINLEAELIINDATTGIKEHRKFTINGILEQDTGRYWEYGNTLSRAIIIDDYERHDIGGDYYSEFVSLNAGTNSKVEVKIN